MSHGESHKDICTFFGQIHISRKSSKNVLNLLGILLFKHKKILCIQTLLFHVYNELPAVCNFVEPT